ncbi:TetR family transcriptional regulator [Amycolatopsis sulphurea]|uniref:TetR family transcriptional regulator n=2 Tax=Amycolatopsis sulphurea TaxID=76022 RepID=A0A2A9FDY2_9PSEU|nr:TetR family transcriptional regulator [Amycolatopsis sulphurea]
MAINIGPENPKVSMVCSRSKYGYGRFTMSTQPARASRPRDRKAQLAAVAAGLFRVRGFHGVSVIDIAAEAGITGPALYRHFTDKQAILAYVVLGGIDEMEAVTSASLACSEVPAEQLSTLLTGMATHGVERREIAALWRWEGPHLPREERREIRRRSSAVLDAWTKLLRTLRPELTTDNAEFLCWAALSVFGSVAVHHTSVARKRFVSLLAELASDVLDATLPESAPVATITPGLGTPSRREQILTAATSLFGERGFHAVSMEDIGAAAGIAGPSVYRHFPSKAALMGAIGHRAADRLALAAEQALQAPDETTALRQLAASYVRTLLRTPEMLVSFTEGRVAVPDRDKADLLRVQRDYVGQWVALLTAAQPGLPAREAKIRVHAALTIANDLSRTRPVNGRPGLEAELTALLETALGLG